MYQMMVRRRIQERLLAGKGCNIKRVVMEGLTRKFTNKVTFTNDSTEVR